MKRGTLVHRLLLPLVLAGCSGSLKDATKAFQPTAVVPTVASLSIVEGESYDFGSHYTLTTTAKVFTLYNGGNGAATAIGPAASPVLVSPFLFSGGAFPGNSGTCGTTLEPQASCTFVIDFTPTSPGHFTGITAFTYSTGTDTAQIPLQLSGTSIDAASLTISDGPNFSYGNVNLNTVNDKVFVLTNSGGVDATAVVPGPSPLSAPFSFKGGTYPGSGGTCGATLPALSTCTLVVTFNPIASGNYNDTIGITYQNGIGPQFAVRPVSGISLASSASLVLSDAPSYDFGSHFVGSVTSKGFSVTNYGQLTATAMSGASFLSPFSYTGGSYPGTGGDCGASLGSLASCTIVVDFSPVTAGGFNDNLVVNYYDGFFSTFVSRNISAHGQTPAAIAISGTSNFGTRLTGSNTSLSYTVSNTGTTIANTLAPGTPALVAPFSFAGGSYPGTGGNCGNTLSPLSSCSIAVAFAPTASGSFNDTIRLGYADGITTQTTTYGISGNGQTPASISVSDGPTYNFGTKVAGSSTDKTFTLTNSGQTGASSMGAGSPPIFAPLSFKGGSYPGTGGTCGATLAASASCTVVLTYAPTVAGAMSETLLVAYSDGQTTQNASRAVTGTGASAATLTISDGPGYDYGTQFIGSSTDKTFTITNGGATQATTIAAGTPALTAPFSYKGGSFPGTGGTCASALTAGGSCTVVVTYAPTGSGIGSSAINISYFDGLASQNASRSVVGTARAAALLTISDGPTFDYGLHYTGTGTDKQFTVLNSGAVPATSLAVGTPALNAPYAFKGGSFPGTGGNCGSTIAAGSSCSIVVRYSPTASGTFNDTIRLSYNDGQAAQNATRAVTGMAQTPAQIAISDGPTYDFGSHLTNTSTDATLTLTNGGETDATSVQIGAPALNTPYTFKGGSFPGTGGTCTSTLAASASCTIVLNFAPTTAATFNDTVRISYNDGQAVQTAARPITGQAGTPAVVALSDNPSYDFGTRLTGSATDKALTLSNSGQLNATSITAGTPALSAPFSYKGGTFPGTGGTCSATLAPASSCTIIVTYSPTSNVGSSDTVRVAFYDGQSAQSVSRTVIGSGSSAALLTISDGPTYDYGTKFISTSTDRTFTIFNAGQFIASAIGAGSPALAAPFSFKGGSYPGTGGTCGSTLASSASCTIVVTFAPTTSGTPSDSIRLSYNDGVTTQTATRAVSGTAQTPASISISDGPTYNYGSVLLNATADKTLTLTNGGQTTAASLGVGSPALAAPYSFKGGTYPGTGGNCASSLAAAATCTLVVTFAPTASGTFNDTVRVSFNDGQTTQSAARNVTGTGTSGAILGISDGPTYDYGTKLTGSTTNKTFTITNSGQSTATVMGAGSPALGTPYSFLGGSYPGTGGTCSASLAAGNSCTVVVSYAPSVAGVSSDTLRVTYYDASTTLTASRGVTGTANTPANLSISDGATYDFGTQFLSSSTDKTFTVFNGGQTAASSFGSGTAMLTPFSFKGGSFPGTGGTCTAALAAGSSCTIVVTFAPTVAGTPTDTVTLSYHNGLSTQTSLRPITGTAVAVGVLTISDGTTYDFGSVLLGGTADKFFTLTNTGQSTISNLQTGAPALNPPYSFKGGSFPGTGGNCGTSLAATASCTIVVTFAPTAAVTSNDTVRISYNNGQSTQLSSRPVTGLGVVPASLSISDGPVFNYGNQYVTTSADKTFTVTNTNGTDATAISAGALGSPFSFLGGSYPGTGGTCGTSLVAFASCSIVVHFAPTVPGLASDLISLSFNNGVNSQSTSRTIVGTGTGVPTQLAITGPATFSAGACTPFTVYTEDAGGTPANVPADTTLTFSGVAAGSFYSDSGCTLAIGGATILANSDSYPAFFKDGTPQSLSLKVNGGGYTQGSKSTQALQPAVLSVSDGPIYDYGSQIINTNTDHTFTVTNSGAVTATSVGASGLNAPFSFAGGSYPGGGGTCSNTLASGASCTVVARFRPTTSGNASSAVQIVYNDSVNLQVASTNITAVGVGTPSKLGWSGPSSIIATTCSSFTVQSQDSANFPTVVLADTTVNLTGYGNGQFFSDSICSAPIFTTTIVHATYSTQIYFRDNTAESLTFNAAASGLTAGTYALPVKAPALLVISDGPTYSYGSLVATGATVTHTFTVNNTGGVTATAMGGGSFAAPFSFIGGSYPGTGGTCGTTLANGASCTIAAQFSPVSSGTFNDNARVIYNDGTTLQISQRGVTGTAYGSATKFALTGQASPTSGVCNPYVVTSQDPSSAAAPLSSSTNLTFSRTGTGTGTFYTDSGCSSAVSGTVSMSSGVSTLTIYFKGAAAGAETLKVSNGTLTDGTVAITVLSNALLTVSDASTYNFGTLVLSTGSSHLFTVTNSGQVSATSMGATTPATPFAFTGGAYPGTNGTCSTTLAASASCQVEVIFLPSTQAQYNATLTILYFDGAQIQTALRPLVGIGVVATQPFHVSRQFNAYVRQIMAVSDGSGDIIVVGTFTQYNDTAAPGIIRLRSDLSVNTTFNPGTGINNSILSVAEDGLGYIYIGGSFTTYNGTSRPGIARVNESTGALDTSTFLPGAGFTGTLPSQIAVGNGASGQSIYCLVGSGSPKYKGVAVPFLTRLDVSGNLDTAFNTNLGTGFSAGVNSFQLFSSSGVVQYIYVGGAFTAINGTTVNRLARLNNDGSLDTAFNTLISPAFNYTLNTSEAVSNIFMDPNGTGDIFLNGSLTWYKGAGVPGSLFRINTATGAINSSFASYNGGTATTMIPSPDGSGDYFVSNLTSWAGATLGRIARLTSAGAVNTSFAQGSAANTTVATLAAGSDTFGNKYIYAGGAFTSYNLKAYNSIIKFNMDGSVNANTAQGVGINYTNGTLNQAQVYKIYPETNGFERVLFAGQFTIFNGSVTSDLFRMNPDVSVDSTFSAGSGFNGSSIVYAFSPTTDGSGDYVAGGNFTSYNGLSVGRLLRITSGGAVVNSFSVGGGFNSDVRAILPDPAGTGFYVGGAFTTLNSTTYNRLVKLDQYGNVDTSFTGNVSGFDNSVFAIVAVGDGTNDIYVAGNFTTYNGTAAPRIIRLKSDGTVNTTFAPTACNNQILTLMVTGTSGTVWAGGSFTSFNGTTRNRLVRILSSGAYDSSFTLGTGYNNDVRAIIPANDSSGDWYVGGAFTTYQGATANRLMRITNSGAAVSSFATGNGPNSTVYTIAPVLDGTKDIWVGGTFSVYNGTITDAAIRLRDTGVIY